MDQTGLVQSRANAVDVPPARVREEKRGGACHVVREVQEVGPALS